MREKHKNNFFPCNKKKTSNGRQVYHGGRVRYKRMADERKKYRYPITDEERLTRKIYMREYRKKSARMKWLWLLAIEHAVGGETRPPEYKTAEEPYLPPPHCANQIRLQPVDRIAKTVRVTHNNGTKQFTISIDTEKIKSAGLFYPSSS